MNWKTNVITGWYQSGGSQYENWVKKWYDLPIVLYQTKKRLTALGVRLFPYLNEFLQPDGKYL